MDDLLKKASIQNKIDADVVSEILDIGVFRCSKKLLDVADFHLAAL